MKKLLLLLPLVILSCQDKLPYGLEISKIDDMYSVIDKNGWPILQENKNMTIPEVDKYGKIKHLLSYSLNKKGFVVKAISCNSRNLYIFVKPKKIQKYAELAIDYKVYNDIEYEKLHLEDDWNFIRGY
jgi:hypothetical protein